MATKLKNLRIKKVDFVDEGANPDAHIRLMKSKDEEGSPDSEDTGKGAGGIFQKLFSFIGKAAGMDQEEIDSAMDKIQKSDAVSFREKINEVNNRKIVDEIWDTCYALQSSLCSILNDEEIDNAGTETAMKESLDEFYAVVQQSVQNWSSGKEANIVMKNEEVSETELEVMKAAVERMNETIEKAGKDAGNKEKSDGEESDNNKNPKGEEKEIMIDKSKLTEAERAFYESIEKRYGTEEETEPCSGSTTTGTATDHPDPAPASDGQTVTKSGTQTAGGEIQIPETDEPDNIYKGLHPAVRAELESLKKFREDAENRELIEIAKKYAIIGKKEEELVPQLKSLKASGGTAYNDMIVLLDQTVDVVEKSGVFAEIGKSGHGDTDGSAWSEAEAKAIELMKSKTGLSKEQALDEVFMANPELAERCEKED